MFDYDCFYVDYITSKMTTIQFGKKNIIFNFFSNNLKIFTPGHDS